MKDIKQEILLNSNTCICYNENEVRIVDSVYDFKQGSDISS